MKTTTTWRRVAVVALGLMLTTAADAAAQSSIARAMSRAELAVERAMERMGDALQRSGDGSGWTREADAFHWTGTVPRGQILEIKGVNGSVAVERADGDEVEVTATARGRRSDPAEVRIERLEHDEGVTFCAVYPSPRGREENRCAPGDGGRMNTRNNDVRVDFVVRLPDGVRMSGRTVNGDVEGAGLASDVALQTVNGDVRVRTTGYAEASTVNGSIEASIGRLDDEGGLRFETVNGSIELDLPDDADAEVDASWVNGGLDSELPLMVQGRIGRRSARGTLGDGGPLLRLDTVNGSIHIR